ncbi:MAG: hypothetical protein HZB29_13925 [Nitrospinae bacterium]|nr:hypothetical protein [Nitrospinota bacterium]
MRARIDTLTGNILSMGEDKYPSDPASVITLDAPGDMCDYLPIEDHIYDAVAAIIRPRNPAEALSAADLLALYGIGA